MRRIVFQETELFKTKGEPVPIWMLLDSDSTHEFKYFDVKNDAFPLLREPKRVRFESYSPKIQNRCGIRENNGLQ